MNPNMGPPSGTTVVRSKRSSRPKGLPNVPYWVPNRQPQPSSAIQGNNGQVGATAPRNLQLYQITQDHNTPVVNQPVYPHCLQVPGSNNQQQRVGRPLNRLSVLHELQIADFIIDSIVARLMAADKAALENGGVNPSEEIRPAGNSGPMTTGVSQSGAITPVAIRSGPISTAATQNEPITPVGIRRGPISTGASQNGPMTSVANQNGPMTTVSYPSGPITAVGGQSGPMNTGGAESGLHIRSQPRFLANTYPTGPFPPVFNPHSQHTGMQMNAGNLGRVTGSMGSFVNDPINMNQVARGVANLNVGQTPSSPLGFMPHYLPNTVPSGNGNTMGAGYMPPAGNPAWPGMDPRIFTPSNRKE